MLDSRQAKEVPGTQPGTQSIRCPSAAPIDQTSPGQSWTERRPRVLTKKASTEPIVGRNTELIIVHHKYLNDLRISGPGLDLLQDVIIFLVTTNSPLEQSSAGGRNGRRTQESPGVHSSRVCSLVVLLS